MEAIGRGNGDVVALAGAWRWPEWSRHPPGELAAVGERIVAGLEGGAPGEVVPFKRPGKG